MTDPPASTVRGATHAGLARLVAVLVDLEESSWMVWNCCKS
jgi:hypothetical protein